MDKAFVLARLEKFEGRVRHMYRCTGGKVTIGIGHAIETPDDAVALTLAVNGRAATPEEIRNGYVRIEAEPKGLPAGHYEGLSPVRMADEAIDALVSSDFDAFAAQVAEKIQGFSGYPDCVQSALLDMAFNLGLPGLLKFQNLLAACAAADWERAAGECHRMGIGADRNQETAALFRQALPRT